MATNDDLASDSAAGSADAPLSARERLAAARAAAGLPAGRIASPADGSRDRRGRRGAWLGLVLAGGAALLGGAWWWAGRGSGLVDETRVLQQRVLAGEVRGRDMKRAVDAIIRNVDQMSRDELKTAREALDSDWRTAFEKGLAAYFDADDDRKPTLLDEAIDRTLAFRQLRFGLNPQASGPYAGRMRGGRRGRGRDRQEQEGSADADAAKRALAETYSAAVRDRAKERKIDLPEWQ